MRAKIRGLNSLLKAVRGTKKDFQQWRDVGRAKWMEGSKTGGNEGSWKSKLHFPENQEAPDRDYTILPKVTAN